MTYLVLVSHGDFARGLKNSLGMFAGDEIEKVRVFGLQPVNLPIILVSGFFVKLKITAGNEANRFG